ncbi:MAG: efflux RND transporter periplasmic adaptor subunit [Puniceicoccaceae bacterium]
MKKDMYSKGGWLKVLLPIVVLVLSLGTMFALFGLKPEQERKEPVPNYPKVDLYTVQQEQISIIVDAQGTVQARKRTRLTARVSGHIEWVSSDFYEGGRFKQGDTLLRLDPLPYKSALAEAESRLALARSAQLQEMEASEQARRDWESVGAGEPTDLVLRKPQLAKAKADLAAAEVAVQMARENLSYTDIKAPYEGRVESKLVDVGQAIAGQASILGEIFSVDALEIPLAITLDDLAQIESSDADRTVVRLESSIAGVNHTWLAYLDRTAASVNQRTRMITAYARKDPPFNSDNGHLLKPGMFVMAKIEGAVIENGFRVPRGALQPGNIVYRMTEDNRLESRSVNVLHTDTNWAIATDGLGPGDRICLTPLIFFSEGMQVDPVDPEASETPDPKPETRDPD